MHELGRQLHRVFLDRLGPRLDGFKLKPDPTIKTDALVTYMLTYLILMNVFFTFFCVYVKGDGRRSQNKKT